LILQRGFYAVGDRMTPLRIGLAAMVLDLTSNLSLIWLLGGIGLAVTTSLVAVVQCLVSGWLMQERIGRLDWREISRTLWKTLFATTVMIAACWIASGLLPPASGRAFRLVAPLLASIGCYFVAAKIIGLDEPWLLLRRGTSAGPNDSEPLTPSE
jgi:putative peptidoglycan lipid II flippase